MTIQDEIIELENKLLQEFNEKMAKASTEGVLDTDSYYTISELIELANEDGADFYNVQVHVVDGEIVVSNTYKETDEKYLDRLKRAYNRCVIMKENRRKQYEQLHKEFGENK